MRVQNYKVGRWLGVNERSLEKLFADEPYFTRKTLKKIEEKTGIPHCALTRMNGNDLRSLVLSKFLFTIE